MTSKEPAWEINYCPSVFTGPQESGAHSGPTDRIIEKGHVLNIDFGIKLNGYCSDLQRTWYFLKDGETEAPVERRGPGFDRTINAVPAFPQRCRLGEPVGQGF